MRAVSRLAVGCFILLLATGQSGCGSSTPSTPEGSGGNESGSGGHSSGGSSASGGSGSGGSSASSSGGAKGSGGVVGSGGHVGTASGGATGSGGLTGGASGGATGSGGGTTASGGKVGGGGMAAGGSNGSGGLVGTAGGSGSGNTTGGGGSSGGPASGENNFASCMASAGAMKKNMKLPNPFMMHDGTVISTKAQWECRRAEIKADLEKYEIGPKQDPSGLTVKATLSGMKLSVDVTVGSNTITLSGTISGSGSCLVIGMGGTTSLVTGCMQLPFSTDQVVKYDGTDSNQYQTDPFYKLYPSLWQKIGNYSAWSWGVSRLIDGLAQVKDQLKLDMTKIGTWGCSYAGKMSLFAGALDERVALTIVEESGGGGINAWRTSQEFVDRTMMSIEKIDNTNYGWFMPSMQKLDPYSLPHDHHELIAMIAPRATIILGNDNYVWLGDESGYKSTQAALQVFTALGVADHIGWDFTSNSGQAHCGPPATQKTSVNTFVQRYLVGGTGATSVAIKPPTSSFDLDWTKDVDWTAPTLQ